MEIIVKQMRLINFKGVLGERTIDFNGKLTEIYGANRTGKTTIADGFRWCLFGKNSEGAATFGIKTKNESGMVIPQLDHEVVLLLNVDGTDVELRRVLQEKWGKPIGSKEKVLTGHTTLYFINGNKFTEKDYKAYIDELCSEALFLSITNPSHFVNLRADIQRSLLTKMVGDVSQEDIAKGNKDFEWLLKEMGCEDMQAFMEHVAYQKKQVKEDLERIPIRINEQQNGVAELMAQGSNWDEQEEELKATEKAIQRIDDEIADRTKIVDRLHDARMDKRNRINKLYDEITSFKRKHQLEYNADVTDANDVENEFAANVDNAKKAVERAERDIKFNEQYIAQDAKRREERTAKWEERKADFRQRWATASKEQFTYDENSTEFVCPTCHRRYEAEDIEEGIEHMRANWNADHAKRMEKLKAEAQLMKDEQATEESRYESNIEAYKADLEKANNELRDATAKLNDARLAQEKHTAVAIVPLEKRIESDARITRLYTDIKVLEEELEKPTDNEQPTGGIDSLKADKAQLQQKRDEQKLLLNNREIIKGAQARIKELEAQEAKLNEQLTELEHKEYTAQTMQEQMIAELESRVNKLFTIVRFEMFDHKLNGTLKPTCECTVLGVPYSDLNNAGRINAGIDIINAICKYNNIYAPCFIDNAESINDVMPMQSQQILLRVSTDKELVINK